MKILKWLGIIIVSLLIIGAAAMFLLSESEPEGYEGTEADNLAKEMLSALNYDAFQDLRYLQFSFFRGEHHYKWDKHENVAEISWGDYKVVMKLDTREAKVFEAGAPMNNEIQANAVINEAWKYWCNDSFWMIAPYKVFDPGTTRSVLETENGNTRGLKVKYTSGGYTPGDAYLWEIASDGKPISWKMWTSILPVQGMSFTWERWVDVEGALLSTFHSNSVLEMEMTNIKGGNDLTQLGWAPDTFNYK